MILAMFVMFQVDKKKIKFEIPSLAKKLPPNFGLAAGWIWQRGEVCLECNVNQVSGQPCTKVSRTSRANFRIFRILLFFFKFFVWTLCDHYNL